MTLFPHWVSFAINLISGLFMIGLSLGKSSSSDATVIICLILLMGMGISYEIGRLERISFGGQLDNMRQMLKIRAKLGDEDAIEEYEMYQEVQNNFDDAGKIFKANQVVTVLLSLFLVYVIIITYPW